MVLSSRLTARLSGLSHAQLHEIAVARCEASLASPQAQVGRTSTRRGNAMQRLRTVPSSRLAARLFELSHAQLHEIAVAGCEASPEVTNHAEAILAANNPLAQRLVEGVLLSSDLAPHLLAPLPLEDGAAAAVCSLWAEGWKATSEGRRRLVRVAFDLPDEDALPDDRECHGMAAIPGDDGKLAVASWLGVTIYDRSMRVVTSFTEVRTDVHEAGGYVRVCGRIAADEQSIYISESKAEGELRDGRRGLLKVAHDGTELARYEAPDGTLFDWDDAERDGYGPVLAPDGLLFCTQRGLGETENGDLHDWDEIIALDAHSMQPRYRFGKSLFGSDMLNARWGGGGSARGLAVAGEELFVCDMQNDRLQVFSLAGEHRRSITGDWKQPQSLCAIKDRLYLVEGWSHSDIHGDQFGPSPYEDKQTRGRRIFVLSLQGDTLQVCPVPTRQSTWNSFSCGNLCCFDGKLLVPMVGDVMSMGDASHDSFEIVALLGT